jgi:hypothetical protein
MEGCKVKGKVVPVLHMDIRPIGGILDLDNRWR